MAEEPNSDTFSLEDLDKILEEEDPGFTESLEQIKSESLEDTSSIEALGVDTEDEDDNGKPEVDEASLTPLQKLRKKLAVPVNAVREFLYTRVRTARNRLILYKSQVTEFVKHELPERWKWFKAEVKKAKESSQAAFKDFWAKPMSERLAYLGIGLSALGALVFLAMTFKGQWLPRWEDPILESYESVGEKLGQFDMGKNSLPLFEAFPEVEFPVRLKEVKVNLRRDANSGSLPMGLFEFYLGVDSRDTAIELRDREKEIIDLVQRTLEGFTYHEVVSYQGKIRMKARIRDNVNAILNQGQVNRVYINRMVTHH